MKKRIRSLLLAALSAVAFGSPVLGSNRHAQIARAEQVMAVTGRMDWYVSVNGSGSGTTADDPSNLERALAAAPNGATIHVVGNITRRVPLTIKQDLHFVGENSDATLNLNDSLTLEGATTFRNMTLTTNGDGDAGANIIVKKSLSLSNVSTLIGANQSTERPTLILGAADGSQNTAVRLDVQSANNTRFRAIFGRADATVRLAANIEVDQGVMNDGKKLSVTTASNRVNIFKNQNGGSFSLTLDGSRLYGAELHELTDVILSNKASVAIDALSGQPNIQLPENTELSAGDLALTLGTVEGSGLIRFSDKGQLMVQQFVQEPTIEFKRNDLNFREHAGKTFVQTGQGSAKVLLVPIGVQLTEEPAGKYIYEQAFNEDYSVYYTAKNTDQTTGAADPFDAVWDILPADDDSLTQEPTRPADYDKDVRDEKNHGTWKFDRWELQKNGKEYEYISYWTLIPDQLNPNPQPEVKQGWKDENGARYYYVDGVKQYSKWIEDLYYVDESGKLLTSTFTPDGFRVGADGRWARGSWKQDSKGWWYGFTDGYYYAGGWFTIKNIPFYFDAKGYLVVNSWIDFYYVNSNGVRLKNTFTPDGYRVGADGKWVKGRWIKDTTGWWYRYEDGFFHKDEWKRIDKKWYHFDKQGYTSTSKWIGDYYLGADGAMLESTFTPDGYYVDADGEWDRTVPRKK
ncbi:MAG: hypothetical protein Q4D52_01455 [Eubacteriales bacterium]|nr:hypothetical protein [Eubacteriales bacterium]